MAATIQDLAPELVHHIFQYLSTVSDVINLSLSCRRFAHMLRHARRLPTLFAAAEREYGPIDDVVQLITFNHAQPVHIHKDPPRTELLLRQIIKIGMTGKKWEVLYPKKRWDIDYMNRRELSAAEGYRIRRAIYRLWLFAEAFGKHLRSQRLLPSAVEQRCQLLRNWTSQELIEIEDVWRILEDVLSFDMCPADGVVAARLGEDAVFHSHFATSGQRQSHGHGFEHLRSNFHNTRGHHRHAILPAHQARQQEMHGWGDDISQYHAVQAMLKLNPGQIMWLYEHATTKCQVEGYVAEAGGDYFWNNGQTFSDTWAAVLRDRGVDLDEIDAGILDRPGALPAPASGDGKTVMMDGVHVELR